jgi:hypothetical protein
LAYIDKGQIALGHENGSPFESAIPQVSERIVSFRERIDMRGCPHGRAIAKKDFLSINQNTITPIVWIDHHEALVFHFSANDIGRLVLHPDIQPDTSITRPCAQKLNRFGEPREQNDRISRRRCFLS